MSETLSISQYKALPFANSRCTKTNRKPAHHESELQQGCVKWFRAQYGRYSRLLFAIPNGGKRRPVEAAIMQAEGVTPGVSDLMLAMPCKEYHGLFIEMKYGSNKQTDEQKAFELAVKAQGYRYEICNSFEGFNELIDGYLKES